MKKIKIGAFGVFSLEYTGKKLKLYIDYKYFFFHILQPGQKCPVYRFACTQHEIMMRRFAPKIKRKALDFSDIAHESWLRIS